ncbi:MAG: hypothetical protein KUG69_10655, partial [Marinosulfonomonas sp.]|nr:hypothetical protein [Marinosulfonomonas sp.]
MTSKSTTAAIRFGYGLGRRAGPASATGLLSGLADGKRIAKEFPVQSSSDVLLSIKKFRAETKAAKNAGTGGSDG